jgi:hypothetical protein
LVPTVMVSSPAARWGTGRQTSDGEVRFGSPTIDWWRRISRRSRRRAAAAAQRRCGRGSSDGGEERGDAQQCAAPGTSMWPREDARRVTGRGGSVGGASSAVAVRRQPRKLGLKRVGSLGRPTRALGGRVGTRGELGVTGLARQQAEQQGCRRR